VLVAGLLAACSDREAGSGESSSGTSAPAQQARPESQAAQEHTASKPAQLEAEDHPHAGGEVPAFVRALFPEAEEVVKRHKQLTVAQAAEVERLSGSKLAERDFHSYVGYRAVSGQVQVLGAATVVDVPGEQLQMVVLYDRDLVRRKVVPVGGNNGNLPSGFFAQFVGADTGQQAAAQGTAGGTAAAAARALHRDLLAMRMLYGTEKKQ
jgi:hypothetical protein